MTRENVLVYIVLVSWSSPGRLYSTGQGSSGSDDIDPGLRLGDYPVLPWRSAQLNKQTGWWDNQDRRDKETPVSAVLSGECWVERTCSFSLCVAT